MSEKKPKTATVIVGGKEYRLQHPGVKWYMENIDDSRDARGAMSVGKYTQNLLDNVVVSPAGLKMDDFDSVGEMEALIQQVDRFLRA